MKRHIALWRRIGCGVLAGVLLFGAVAAADDSGTDIGNETEVGTEVTDNADLPDTTAEEPAAEGSSAESAEESAGEEAAAEETAPAASEEDSVTVEDTADAVPVQSVKAETSVRMKVGGGHRLSVTVLPENATNRTVTYRSSNSAVVSVSSKGKLLAKKLGTAKITVRAADGSGKKAVVTVKVCLKRPTNVHAVCSSKGNAYFHVHWNKVSGAVKYAVQRKVGSGSWTTIARVKGNAYTDKHTKGGKVHRYRVVAIPSDSTYKSRASKVYKTSLLIRPYGCKISEISDSGIQFYWKKPDVREGYEVYRSYSKKGPFTRIAVVKTPEQGFYTDGKFNQKKNKVYYRVRSYGTDENGKKIYSKLSMIRCAEYRSALVLERELLYMRSGNSRKLNAYYGWGNARSLTWTSSNPSVATVSSTGKIKAVSKGKCTIRCTSKKLGVTKKCRVTVDRSALSSLTKIISDFSEADGIWQNGGDSNDAVIMMTGDMMCTGTQQKVQGFATGNYNFNESFDGVKDIISGADFAIGNLETVISPTWPYMHEEAFIENRANCNAPNRYLDAVKYAGFDGVVMATNHNADAGIQGIKETVEQVDRYKLARTGVFSGSKDKRYFIADVNGIKVGYLAYVTPETGYNHKDENWSQKAKDTYLNYYSKERAESDIAEMREAGAEYVIVYMHWGIKNVGTIKPSQKKAAQELADLGVNYIVGAHCHLLQEYTTITAKDGTEVPCLYSLGDFQSSIEQIAGNRDSVILRIRLQRDKDGNVVLAGNGYIPCCTYTHHNGKWYNTIPLNTSMNGGDSLSNYSAARARIKKAIGSKLKEYTGA